MLLSILLQNCSFDPGTLYHISVFPSKILSAFSVHNSDSCGRWFSSICMSPCCLAKCCCTQCTHSGANALSVIIQESEGQDLCGLTSAKERAHMKKTEHYLRVFFSLLHFFFLHFHTLTLLYQSLVQYIPLATQQCGSCAVARLIWEESCQPTNWGRQCRHGTTFSPGQAWKIFLQLLLLKAQFGPW